MEVQPGTKFKLNIAILLYLIGQTVAAIWWAASINSQVINTNSQVANTMTQVELIRSQINDGVGSYLTRAQLDDILGGRDEKLNALQKSQDETKAAVLRIEQKLDR